jgi:hypothetical protein
MIAKIKSGQGFGGLVNYANDVNEKNARILHAEGVSTTSNATVTASFKCQAQGCGVKNFVGHVVLSFSPKDMARLSDELMVEIAQEYMKRMGIVDTQYIIYRHEDKAHPHLHVIYNRVNNRKKEIKGDHNFRKSAAVTKALTREYGLTFGKGKDEVNRDRLRGNAKVKYHIYDTIKAALPFVNSWDELRAALADHGIDVRFSYRSDGRIKGVSFSYGNVSFAGGKIDRNMTYGKLDAALRALAIRAVGNTSPSGQFRIDESSQPSGIVPSSNTGINDSPNAASAIANASIGSTSDGSGGLTGTATLENLADAAMEIVLQPHVAPTSGGGGGSNDDRGWNDEDKDKNVYKPKRRR